LDWRAKVELFEQIRREYEFGAGTIQGVAQKLGVHRRMVREALASVVPARRKKNQRPHVKMAPAADRKAPRKQRHTARRIYERIRCEAPECTAAEWRIAVGLDPNVGSVVSLFVSRWDVAVAHKAPEWLRNQLGIAVAWQTYERYQLLLDSRRWQSIFNAGARPQRLLWPAQEPKIPTLPICYTLTPSQYRSLSTRCPRLR
jgi:hypothetical protein